MELWVGVILALPPGIFFLPLLAHMLSNPSVLLPFLSRLLIIFTFFDAELNPEADGVSATQPTAFSHLVEHVWGLCNELGPF